jgi:hypothetical protein
MTESNRAAVTQSLIRKGVWLRKACFGNECHNP